MTRADVTDLKAMSRRAEEAAGLLRSLSHTARLRVLCELSAGERSVGELVRSSGLSQSALSQHLSRLREEGIVATRRDAQTIYYRVVDSRAKRLILMLHDLYCGK